MRARKPGDQFYALDIANGGISVFQDGIFVTQQEILASFGR